MKTIFNSKTHPALIYFFLLIFAFVLGACNTTEPPDGDGDNKPDTTSHNFTWETFTFGEQSSSVLYDVAIIDENNIWAVGEIYMYDSTGTIDPYPYNAIHWAGSEWELKKIIVEYKGNQTIAPLYGIYVLPDGNIVFSSGLPYLPEGDDWKLYHLWEMGILSDDDGSVKHIWGTSVNDLYFAGDRGTIVHYNGNRWLKIESGTELNIQDIYGSINTNNGEVEILCIASDKYQNNGYSLIKIVDNTADKLTATELPWSLSSIWFIPGKKYYLGGDGLYMANNPERAWQKETNFPTYYKDRIRGIGYNDIVVSGSNGLLSHYNGNTWKHYMEEELPYIVGRYSSVNIKGDIIVSVGYRDREAIIVLGKR
ncbi:MAG: glucosyl transferase [Melioribacteraceae bacterium]|nr:glucosyl transferase [Melioribacteraceae bacterium]WKZ69098.1 MAG: glucosyl transferase [Melioribacteraceae bacterium]